MSSDSDSDKGSVRSSSPSHHDGSVASPAPHTGDHSGSNSPAPRRHTPSDKSDKSPSRSRSPSRSPQSQTSASSSRDKRRRSPSVTSNRSHSPTPERANSRSSNRSESAASNRSESPNSHRSRSGSRSATPASPRSQASHRSRSRSHSSHKSDSDASERSHHSNKTQSTNKSRSASRSPSHDSNAASNKKGDKSGDEDKDEEKEKEEEEDKSTEKSQPAVSPKEKMDRKKLRIIDTDSEEDETFKDDEVQSGPDAAALFGDADDITSGEDEDDEKRGNNVRDSDDRGDRNSDDENQDRLPNDDDANHLMEEGGEKEIDVPETIPETRIDVEIPKIGCDLGRDIHFVKLPNFLSVDTRPFDHETYEDEIDEEETLDEEGRARLKLKVENTIRWRDAMDKDGTVAKESNARFVRWSDGSLSLHLGSEIFDVYKQPLQGDHNHLFIRQGTGLQGQAVFRTKLSFRPHSTESFTHRKMTLSLADRSQKVSGIKILSQVGADPDHDRHMLLKKEEEKLRQSARHTKVRKRESTIRTHHTRESYKEEDGSDEDGAISLNAIKNKYKSGAALPQSKGGAIYSSDEEGSDFETRRTKKQDKPKALKDSESSDSD